MKRHHLTPKGKADIERIISELERVLDANGVIRFWSAHRCGHCASCFRRGIVEALAVEVGEG